MTWHLLRHRAPDEPLNIINVSSLAAFYPMPFKAVYAASKRFLLDWSLALNEELRHQRVAVTVLCPAGLPTYPATMRVIEAQGLMGRITTMNVGDVAAMTLDQALAGRRVVIPGLVNRVLRLLGRIAPPALAAALINRRWRKSHAKSHGSLQAGFVVRLDSLNNGLRR
jgi:short-subunit dehydrogenase